MVYAWDMIYLLMTNVDVMNRPSLLMVKKKPMVMTGWLMIVLTT